MKVTDLMIGDWLHAKGFEVNTRVIGIESNAAWLDDKSVWCRRFEEEIDPIPLTAEILEKNGFKVVNRVGRVEYTMEDYFHVIEIYEYNDMTYWMHSESKEFNLPTARVININYVHELQHALRMCGVEKEIVLI